MLQGWLQIALFIAVLVALTPLLGGYMARVYTGERVFLTAVIGPLERLFHRALRVDVTRGQDWKRYARSVLVLSGLFWLALYLILRTQTLHPWNPEGFHSGTWDVTFNTVSSFITNTNWQYYGGETTMTYFSQMAGLAVQNFVSAAVGICVAVALIRGIASRTGGSLGNFWQDLVRTLLYVLLPISIIGALLLVSQGTIQSFADYATATTVVGGEQTIAFGPVASQEIIKELGTNGGGFFNTNSAMPFENPSGFSNFVEMLAILLIPAALTATYGRMVGSRRQGWAISPRWRSCS
jgi:potassium-transporting ATPase potassium-binding subunit